MGRYVGVGPACKRHVIPFSFPNLPGMPFLFSPCLCPGTNIITHICLTPSLLMDVDMWKRETGQFSVVGRTGKNIILEYALLQDILLVAMLRLGRWRDTI